MVVGGRVHPQEILEGVKHLGRKLWWVVGPFFLGGKESRSNEEINEGSNTIEDEREGESINQRSRDNKGDEREAYAGGKWSWLLIWLIIITAWVRETAVTGKEEMRGGRRRG